MTLIDLDNVNRNAKILRDESARFTKPRGAAGIDHADVLLEPTDAPAADRCVEDQPSIRREHRFVDAVAEVNKELWLVLSMLAIAGAANYLVAGQKILFGLYTLPTIFAAFCWGRRHATLTAAASALLVGFLVYMNPALWSDADTHGLVNGRFLDLFAWGLTLMLTAFTMGTLHERQTAQSAELRETYQGLLLILRQFISKDKYTENHSYRVSVYAASIAHQLGFHAERVELVRAAALLHDLGKLDVSRSVLHKAARLTESESREVREHAERGARMLAPVAASMGRILPIILAHHDRYDGSGYRPIAGKDIPIEARVIAVADVYDALTSDRPYRKALPPCAAKDTIVDGSGKDFDPVVVTAFQRSYDRGLLEVPEIYV